MNIFFLSLNPILAARYHGNKHVVKMILETAQILYSVWHLTSSIKFGPDSIDPYRLTHKNHPCNIWARECTANYIWLCDLGLALCKEYTYRYKKIHKTEQHIRWLSENIPNIRKQCSITPPALAMPDEYKVSGDPVQSYRNVMRGEKAHLCVYKNRSKPFWL